MFLPAWEYSHISNIYFVDLISIFCNCACVKSEKQNKYAYFQGIVRVLRTESTIGKLENAQNLFTHNRKYPTNTYKQFDVDNILKFQKQL